MSENPFLRTSGSRRRVVILQSSYLPWRGYFDLIDDADQYVVYDDVQYTRRDWRNRNRIKSANGVHWITVPVRFSRDQPTSIDQAPIDHTQSWARRHIESITHAYARAPFFNWATNSLFHILRQKHSFIGELNLELIREICRMLEIDTPVIESRELEVTGTKTDRLISVIKKVGGSIYLSGPAAKAYLEPERFSSEGIGLEYKVYDYAAYPQLHHGFEGSLSIIDLLVMAGPEARVHLKSQTAPQRIV